MTKKPKRNPGINYGRVWSDSDFFHLCAWLDYCCEYAIDFKATVIEHLKETTQKEFKWEQIDRKLRRTWDNTGREDSTFDDVYSQGTSCLVLLAHDETQAIRELRCQISSPLLRLRLRSASLALETRSLSRTRRLSNSSTISTLSTISTYDLEGTDCDESHKKASLDRKAKILIKTKV